MSFWVYMYISEMCTWSGILVEIVRLLFKMILISCIVTNNAQLVTLLTSLPTLDAHLKKFTFH